VHPLQQTLVFLVEVEIDLFYSIALLTNNAIENELFAPKTIISLEKMFIKVDNEK